MSPSNTSDLGELSLPEAKFDLAFKKTYIPLGWQDPK